MAALTVVEESPLVVQICLSCGVTVGRYEATEDLTEGIKALRKKYPGRQFQFIPESYNTVDGENPALVSILAVGM